MINKMHIIYDDIIYSLQKSGGISVYWKMLEDGIPVANRLVYDGRTANIFYKQRDNERAYTSRLLFERYRNVRLKESEPFIFHSSYYRCCKDKGAVNITTVHDFTYERFRSDFKSGLHKIQKKNAVMHSDGVICISENTRQDLHRHYPDYNGKVRVIYHGYDDAVFISSSMGIGRRNQTVLFVGSRVSYKRFDFAVRLVSEFPHLRLLIVGGGDLSASETTLLDSAIPNRYEKCGFVANEDLARLYNESFALLYPSEYEGFGFPVIEAQACGCPVICQRKSSVPEVSGDKCVYVDSADFGVSVEAVRKLFDPLYYAGLQESALENVKRFSWQKCVRETVAFYEECFGGKFC